MQTIWIIFTCVVMSNFLKAAQDSEPVSSHLPPASEGSSYSVCPDSVFISCNLLEDLVVLVPLSLLHLCPHWHCSGKALPSEKWSAIRICGSRIVELRGSRD